LSLEVAKRIVTAARTRAVALDHIQLLCCAGMQLQAAKPIVRTLGMQSYKTASWEAAQSTSSREKWLPREDVAERRSASAKRSLGEEIAQQSKGARPSIHSFIHSFVH